MRPTSCLFIVFSAFLTGLVSVPADVRGHEEPTMLYSCLLRRAESLSSQCLFELPPLEEWRKRLPEKRRRWREMLGLDPLPPRTELKVTVTGILDRGNYVVEKLHFQPLPDCRIACNLYRPKKVEGKLPAVIYVCGHASAGKSHYQLHPRWFAEHGYVSMILDAIQIGENGGFHHGTYLKEWWHWYSQGYSPAGVEVWAAMRAADYLQSRPDVDPDRLGITGNSGGGTISWFTGAADTRFKVVVPSCQTGNVYQHVRDRTIDGHCDCTYWVNTYGWDFPDVAGLIAPRPLLVCAASEDHLFRPYAFRDLVYRVRGLYLAYGCDEKLALCEAMTPHGYSPKTRLALFNWFETHLKGSDAPVTDDLAQTKENSEALAVYKDKKPPAGDRLGEVHDFFIPLPQVPELKGKAEWKSHQEHSLEKLRRITFPLIPKTLLAPDYSCRRQGQSGHWKIRSYEFESEPGMPIRAHLAIPIDGPRPYPVVVGAMRPETRAIFMARGAGNQGVNPKSGGYACVEVRGTGAGSIGPGLEWTARRAYPIVGQSFYERKTLDLLAAIQVLRQQPNVSDIVVFGKGDEAAVAIYAALLDPSISEIVLEEPVITHWNAGPEFLGVLKVGDLPHNLALAYPRPITFVGKMPKEYAWTQECYDSCGAKDKIQNVERLRDWKPRGIAISAREKR